MSRVGPTLVLVLWGAVGGRALDVRVHGDVLFAVQLSEAAQRRVERLEHSPPAPAPAPALACRLRFPEQDQVDAILSNMMNELTKVFVRANHFLKSEDNTRNPGVWRAEEVSPPAPAPSAGAAHSPQATTPAARSSRFKVINSKNTQFFEHIFHNMTEEFRSVHNESSHVARARRDPCSRQGAVRRAWRDLLRRSLAAFRRAALHCVQDYLKIQECEERTKARLVRYLVRELRKMRAQHLQMLCEHFQLCLDEGLLA